MRNVSNKLTPECRRLLESWTWPRNVDGCEEDILGSPGADFWDRWGYAHWFLRCPNCESYPLAKVQRICLVCGEHLHHFRLEWIHGRSKKLPAYLEQARDLGTVLEANGSFSLTFDCYQQDCDTNAFTELACMGILKLTGSDMFHGNRRCLGALPSLWRHCFLGKSGPYSAHLPPESQLFAFTQMPVHEEDYHDDPPGQSTATSG